MQSYTAHESFWTDVKMMLSMIRKAVFVGMLMQMLLLSYLLYDMDKEAYIAGTNEKLSPKIFLKYQGLSIILCKHSYSRTQAIEYIQPNVLQNRSKTGLISAPSFESGRSTFS